MTHSILSTFFGGGCLKVGKYFRNHFHYVSHTQEFFSIFYFFNEKESEYFEALNEVIYNICRVISARELI